MTASDLCRPASAAPVLVSACLLGVPCTHDGRRAALQLDPALLRRAGVHAIPLCPEQLGGLPTPRSPCELRGGDGQAVLAGVARVCSVDGQDRTEAFVRGAEQTLALGRSLGAGWMIAQRRSPSCSCAGIYDGTFTRTLIEGVGLTCAMLQRAGLVVVQADQAADLLGR